MAGPVKINFEANIARIRKAFAELGKQQKKTWDVRQKQLKVEGKYQKEEMKGIKQREKATAAQFRKEQQQAKRARDEKGRFMKEEKRHEEKLRDSRGRFMKKEADHLKNQQKEMKRGPIGRLLGFGGKAAAFAGGGMLGMLIGSALKGYQNYNAFQQSQGQNIGLGRINRAAWQGGSKYGYNVMERGQLAGAMARSTGALSPMTMMRATRATGMDAGYLGGVFNLMRQGGTKFSGMAEVMGEGGKVSEVQQNGQGEKKFTKILAAGMFAGMEKARLPEFVDSLQGMFQSQLNQQTGKVDMVQMAKFAAMLGKKGGEGFTGQRGAAVMQKLEAGLINPNSPESAAFLQRAFGYGRPGGGQSYYNTRKQMQRGITGKDAQGNSNFDQVMNQLVAERGTGQDAAEMLEEVFGVSLDQAEQLIKIHQSGKDSTQKMEDVESIMNESKSLQDQANEAMKKAGTNLSRIAGLFDKSVGRGAEAAKYIEKIEDWQNELVDLMMKWLPRIGKAVESVVSVITDLFNWARSNFGLDMFGSGKKEEAISREHGKYQDLMEQYKKAKTGKERYAIAQKMATTAGYMKNAGAVGGESLFGKGKDELGMKGQSLEIMPELASTLHATMGSFWNEADSSTTDALIDQGRRVYLENKKKGQNHGQALASAKKWIQGEATKLKNPRLKQYQQEMQDKSSEAARAERVSKKKRESKKLREESSVQKVQVESTVRIQGGPAEHMTTEPTTSKTKRRAAGTR